MAGLVRNCSKLLAQVINYGFYIIRLIQVKNIKCVIRDFFNKAATKKIFLKIKNSLIYLKIKLFYI